MRSVYEWRIFVKSKLLNKVTRLSVVLLFAFAMSTTLPGCVCKICGPSVAKKCCGKGGKCCKRKCAADCTKSCCKKKCAAGCTKPCCKKT